MKLALIGATGLVGRKMIEVLEERGIRPEVFLPAASPASVGKTVRFADAEYNVVSIYDALQAQPDVALFSAGGGPSMEWAPRFAAVGTTVIDNSSAWRMMENVPLIVPEVNGESLTPAHKIIANPNCSTIQLVMVLAPLSRYYGLERVIVSTYQSITGTGAAAVSQMEAERAGSNVARRVYAYPIDMNCIPQCDVFDEDDYTKEELKVIRETRKILGINDLPITCTAVRVPVVGGHSESVNLELRRDFNVEEVKNLLASTPGVTLQDVPAENIYPMPLTSHNKDDVFVGRIRRDMSHTNALNLWITADNLRKGAATNAVQILQYLLDKQLLRKN